VPYDAITASSRSLVHMGNAIRSAADDLLGQVKSLAAALGNVEPADVLVLDGLVKAGEWSGTFAALLSDSFGESQGSLEGRGRFNTTRDPKHVLGGPTPFFEAVATAVELSVDRDTGALTLHKVAHATDAGYVVNRQRAVGLDEGGVVMGIGLATSEALLYKDARLANGSSLDYRIPTVYDVPDELISVFIENGDGPGLDGAKGIGEGGILAVAPAISAAIADCAGVWIHDLPLSRNKIWDALRER